MSVAGLARLRDLVLLRYRLQWAQIRNSPAAITVSALLVVLVGLAMLFVFLSGVGLGALAASGRAGDVARLVFGATFVNLLIVSILFGFGMSRAFGERTLRQFPLARTERLIIQYGLALFEPTWLLGFAVYLGCAVGAILLGVTGPWVGLAAALLLTGSNYLVARVILAVIERLVATGTGSFALFILMQTAFLLPMALQGVTFGETTRTVWGVVVAATPPAAAAAMMTRGVSAAAALTLMLWCALPAGLLVLIDRFPARERRVSSQAARWDSLYERVSACFPVSWQPLVGRALRYYLRSPAVRAALISTLPLTIFFVARGSGRPTEASQLFDRAVLFAPLGASLATAAFAMNCFGYDGSGLRRLLLAPVRPALILRTLALVPLLIGAAFACVLLVVWVMLAPVSTDGRMIVMLLGHAGTGLLVYQSILLWPSILAPRRVPYEEKFRNQASLWGQLALLVGMLVLIAAPVLVRVLLLPGPLVQYWWLPLAVLPFALAAYLLVLWTAERLLPARRERLLSVVEGRG